MHETLLIQPAWAQHAQLPKTITLPGSKSLGNRALLMAALSPQTVTLHGLNAGHDTRVALGCLQQLGFHVSVHTQAAQSPAGHAEELQGYEGALGGAAHIRLSVTVVGLAGEIPKAKALLDVGTAGTVGRFLPPFLALRPGGCYTLQGSAAMHRRPVGTALQDLGSLCPVGWALQYLGQEGCFPLCLHTSGVRGGSLCVRASDTSQMVSGLLMSAPYFPEGLQLQVAGKAVSEPFIRMTWGLMQHHGIACTHTGETYHVPGGQLYRFAKDAAGLFAYTVPPDATQASYWAAYAYVSRRDVVLAHAAPDTLQGDWAFLDLLQQQGLVLCKATPEGLRLSPGPADQGFEADLRQISDTFITLAFLAPLLRGPTTLHGLGHTQHQESPRLSAVAQVLSDLGQDVCIQGGQTLRITPRLDALRARALHSAPLTVPSYGDHRIAMALGILGCYDLRGHQKPWLAIRDPLCCNKTYPLYWHALQCLS